MGSSQCPGYTINVDFHLMESAISMVKNNEDHGEGPAVIHPIPWKNAPDANGSTTEFTKRLGECREFMDHFAMHTPQYFFTHKRNEDEDEGLVAKKASGATAASKKSTSRRSTKRSQKATANKPRKAPGSGQGTRGKRKAPVESEGEEGLYP